MEYEVVERLMKEKGVKASDVAKATGIPQSVFTDWKKGRYTPKADKLYVIAKYFGVPMESFFEGEQVHIEEERHYPHHEQTDFVMKLLQNKELYVLIENILNASTEDRERYIQMAKLMGLL